MIRVCFLINLLDLRKVHGKYVEPMILAINSGMIITGWSAKMWFENAHSCEQDDQKLFFRKFIGTDAGFRESRRKKSAIAECIVIDKKKSSE